MLRKFVPVILMIASSIGLGLSAHGAETETEPSSALSTISGAGGPPVNRSPKLTAVQEAALVEVRKILREAKQAAESDTLPNKLMTIFNSERRKTLLLEEIERAQLLAGDLTAAAGTKRLDLLTRAQAQYGDIKGAIQTATRDRVADDELLTLVDTLIKAGDIPAAVTVAQSNFAKNGVELWRQRNQAAVYALIARRQHEAGDPEASATLQKAIKAVPEPKHTPDRYLALLHVARTQAILGDRAGSEESFLNALDAGLAQREPIEKVEALRVIAKAQAESGNRSASDQTFQQAIQTTQTSDAAFPQRVLKIVKLGCIAWNQATTGNKIAANQTFQRAIRNVEEVEMAQRGQALMGLGLWQIKARDLEGARHTVQLLLRRAESLTDPEGKSATIGSAAGLAMRAGDAKQAIELTAQVTDDWEQAGLLASIAKTLISTHDPFGSPEVFQQLAESAAALLKHPPQKERSKREVMRSSIVLVQAAAGDVQAALRTADTISTLSGRIQAYGKAANILTAKADFAHAKRVIQAMEEDWFAGETEAVVRTFTQAQATGADETEALVWARQQKNVYARAQALVGVALGIMQRHSPYIDQIAPVIPMRDWCS